MLSIPGAKRPRLLTIKVAKAEKLVPSKKDNKKKLNIKFRVVISAGKKKETTALVEDANGNPDWGFTCNIKLPRDYSDHVNLLVEDSEGHHKGQVIIPLVKISPKPYTYSPDQSPATSTNLICSELEPTKKCPVAAGFLIYWIWIEEYYTDDDSVSRSSFKSMTSLFNSKSGLKSSNTRLSVPAGSVSNISSGTSLNKPESHKKTLSFLHIKSKKDKSKKTASDCKISPENSDVESYNEPGNPFEGGKGRTFANNRSISGGSSDLRTGGYGYPMNTAPERPAYAPRISPLPDRVDVASLGSTGSVSETGSFAKPGDISDYNPFGNTIAPIDLPPVTMNTLPPKRPTTVADEPRPMPSTLLGKSNLVNSPKSESYNSPPQVTRHSPIDTQFKPGHKAANESDYSIFSDHNVDQQSIPGIFLPDFGSGISTIIPEDLPPVDWNIKTPTTTTKETRRTMPSASLNKFDQSNLRQFTPKTVTGSPQHVAEQRFPADPNFGDFSSNEHAQMDNYYQAHNPIVPTTMPEINSNVMISKSPQAIKDAHQSGLNSKINQNISPSQRSYNQPWEMGSPTRNAEQSFRQSGHKTNNISDHSSLGDRSQYMNSTATVKGVNDEADNLRKENTELKALNTKSNTRISELQSELDYVKECLFKLRTKLLEEGATKFLEKI